MKKYLVVITLMPAFVYAYAELPDPTRPANYIVKTDEPIYVEDLRVTTKEQISWKLSAIRISEKDKSAIINGKLVRVGDEIDKAKIVEIKPLSVVINHQDKKLIVRLFNDLVIKSYKSKE